MIDLAMDRSSSGHKRDSIVVIYGPNRNMVMVARTTTAFAVGQLYNHAVVNLEEVSCVGISKDELEHLLSFFEGVDKIREKRPPEMRGGLGNLMEAAKA